MKTEIFSAIVACSSLLLVHGVRFRGSHKHGIANSSKPIVYGALANPADFPFLVLMRLPTNKKTLMCTGTVIHKHVILTVAHCTWNERFTVIQIFPSTWKQGDVSKFHVVARLRHPDTHGKDYWNDVALMIIEEDLVASGLFKVIPIARYAGFEVGVRASVVGWGLVEHGNKPGPLMRGEVPISPWEECKSAYGSAKKCDGGLKCTYRKIPPHAFCMTSKPPRYFGSCVGDAGGPIIMNGVVTGIMAGTIMTDSNRCNPKLPGLAIQIPQFWWWIKDTAINAGYVI